MNEWLSKSITNHHLADSDVQVDIDEWSDVVFQTLFVVLLKSINFEKHSSTFIEHEVKHCMMKQDVTQI